MKKYLVPNVITIVIVCFIIIFIIMAALSIPPIISTVVLMYKENPIPRIEKFEKYMITRLQNIEAGITFETRRKKIILDCRDFILTQNKNLSPQQAYEIATANYDAISKFKTIPLSLLLAIQNVESHFDINAISEAGAIGITQIWPPTGRMLCRAIQWEYDKNLLLDLKANVYLACTYLDILLTEYENNIIKVLLEYNGGPDEVRKYESEDNATTDVITYSKNVISKMNKIQESLGID